MHAAQLFYTHDCPPCLQLKTHFPGRFPPLSLSVRYWAGFTLQRTMCLFYFRSQLCVGMGSECGALQREVRGVLWAVVLTVSVNSRAVGGRFRSTVGPAAGATAGWWGWASHSLRLAPSPQGFKQLEFVICSQCKERTYVLSMNKDGQRSPVSPIVEETNPKHPGFERTGDVICAGASLKKTNELFICSEISETACCLHVALSLLSSFFTDQ